MSKTYSRRKAQVIMTGHTITLFVSDSAILTSPASDNELKIFKRFILVNSPLLEFTEDNMISFPWLRELIAANHV